MFIDYPENPNGLLVVCDVRLKHDRNLQATQGGTPVLRHWPFGTQCLGTAWARTTRLSLYDYGEDVKPVKEERVVALKDVLGTSKWGAVIVLQTRSARSQNAAKAAAADDAADALHLTGTHCWQAMKAPDRLPDMAGCIWQPSWGPTLGVLNPVNYEWVFREMIRRHFRLGLRIAEKGDCTIRPQHMEYRHGEARLRLLDTILKMNTPVAVDIETNPATNECTAIGFASRGYVVSMNVEPYEIFRQNEIEPGATLAERALIEQLLKSNRPKVFHNFAFDLPFLQEKGFTVNGDTHDTMAMHVTVYKQWPHGLQKACAHELPVAPWKSEYKPEYAKKLGLKREDAGYWTGAPENLRMYNALDAFHTDELAYALAPKVGIRL